MNNQAAQTMPEPVTASMCPSSDYAKGWNDCLAALSQTAGVPARYFADGPQGHFFADDLQLARDLVNLYDKDDDWTITDLRNPTGAAPAASGAHPDALQDGTLSKSTAKRLAAASVSERARAIEILAGVCLLPPSSIAENTDSDVSVELALRAIEQALTQQRGAVLDRPARVGGCLRHPYTGELRDYRDVESDPDGTLCVGPGPLAATTPQPSADAVRELVKRAIPFLMDEAAKYDDDGSNEPLELARELESLLSAASGEKGVG